MAKFGFAESREYTADCVGANLEFDKICHSHRSSRVIPNFSLANIEVDKSGGLRGADHCLEPSGLNCNRAVQVVPYSDALDQTREVVRVMESGD